jgi:hypothetical protein
MAAETVSRIFTPVFEARATAPPKGPSIGDLLSSAGRSCLNRA